jgi:hypothetical protein
MISRVLLVVSLVGLVGSFFGCAGEAEERPGMNEDDVKTRMFKNGDFACTAENATDDDGNPVAPSSVPVSLKLRGTDVSFGSTKAAYDSRYRPRKYVGYSRFAFEYSEGCGTTPTLIVEHKLLDGTSKTGAARFSTQSERCWDPDVRYTCTRL